MDRKALVKALTETCPKNLSEELVDNFIQLRQDVATKTLGRSAPGKFAETFVQILQHLEKGKYETKPDVDDFLKNFESRSSTLDDGLRLCGGRIARAIYTLRNKRNIAHKG